MGAAPPSTPSDPLAEGIAVVQESSLGEARPAIVASDEVVIEAGETSLVVSKDAKVGVSVETEDLTFVMGIPAADSAEYVSTREGHVAFDNHDGSLTAVSSHGDDSLTIVSIIENNDAPTSYTYSYDGIGELRQDDSDRGVTLWRDGKQVGYLLTPWAIDARGQEVPTWYEISGHELTQVVPHRDGNWSYPITADPTQNLGGNSFYSNITLDINMTTANMIVRVTPAPGHNWSRMARSTGIPPYNALVPSTYEARKYHDQLVCHWASAGYLKTPWNLDSWRPDVGYAATVLAACNP